MSDLIYGRNAVYECLRAGRRKVLELRIAEGSQEKDRLAEILDLAQSQQVPVQRVNRKVLDDLAENHQGVILKASDYPYSDVDQILAVADERDEAPFILILDTLQDPQNLGTLLRTAEAAGVHGVLLPYRRTATVTPAVVNASSGASEHLLIAQHNLAQAIGQLKEQDVWVIGLEGGEDAHPVEQVRLDGALALVVGSEGDGMRRLVRESCDLLLRLPMRGQIKSLNAAVAGSLALFLALQARSS